MREFGRDIAGRGRLSFFCAFVLSSVLAGLLAPLAAAAAEETAGPRFTIAVFGDSQAQGIAGALQRLLLEDSRYRVLNRTHPGAALVHGASEWLAPVQSFAAHEKADIAVVMFGANDRLDIPAGADGPYVRFRTDAWRDVYTHRVDKILSALADAGPKIIWCGNPIARSDVYSNDMTYINAIFSAEAERYGAQYFPLWNIAADDDGKYSAHGRDRDGVTRRLRADDGIHFTAAGYELIADKILNLFPPIEANAAAPTP
ncbi:MAG: DUF459 domain-containing protein [Alphaproteobacteria bacterium]|nr:DUF459 domain-containing protein [Alphaproteobacteria bacterium]